MKITYPDMEKLTKAYPYIYVLKHLEGFERTYARKKANGEKVSGWFMALGNA